MTAKYWYENWQQDKEIANLLGLDTKAASKTKDTLLSSKVSGEPLWALARVGVDEVVEVPLKLDQGMTFSNSKTPKEAELNASVTRLLILKDDQGFYYQVYMHIHADAEYLSTCGYNLQKTAYKKVQPGFTGRVFYTSEEGGFINGWIYVNGHINGEIAKMRNIENKFVEQPKTRTVAACWAEYYDIYTRTCYYAVNYCTEWVYAGELEVIMCGTSGGDGGTGGGGGTPPNPPTQPGLPYIDSTGILNNPKAMCVYSKLMQLSHNNNSIIGQYIREFLPDSELYGLTFFIDHNLPDTVSGQAHPPQAFNIAIGLNPDFIARDSPILTALTMVHEIVHAEIYRKLLSLAATEEGGIDEPTVSSLMNGNFPGIFDYYVRYAKGAQHEMMAAHYRDMMANALKAFDNGAHPDSVYQDLAWNGLQGTVSWNMLSPSDKAQILSTNLSFTGTNAPCY